MNKTRYHTFSVEKSGSGSINILTGELEYTQEIILAASNGMSLSFNLVYKSSNSSTKPFGKGVEVKLSPEYDAESDYYKNRIAIEKSGEYFEKITDKQTGDTINFEHENGRTKRIIDTKNNQTIFEYSDDKLSKITYPDGNSYVFIYDGTKLKKVVGKAFTGVEIKWKDNKVESIQDISYLLIRSTATTSYLDSTIEESPTYKGNEIRFAYTSTKIVHVSLPFVGELSYYKKTTTKTDTKTGSQIVYHYCADFYCPNMIADTEEAKKVYLLEGINKEEYKLNGELKGYVDYIRSYTNGGQKELIKYYKGSETTCDTFTETVYDADNKVISEISEGIYDQIENGEASKSIIKTISKTYEYDNKKPTKGISVVTLKDKAAGLELESKEYVTKYTYHTNGRLFKLEDADGNMQEVFYDQNDNITRKVMYHKDSPEQKIYSDSQLDEHGRVISFDDESLNRTEIKYKWNTHTIDKIINPNDNVISFQVDGNSDNIISISSQVDGIDNTNEMTYRQGVVTGLTSYGAKYDYEYYAKNGSSDYDAKKIIKINDEEYMSESILEDAETREDVITNHYATDEEYKSYYDKYGNLNRIDYNDSTIISNIYYEEYSLISTTDHKSGLNTIYKYDSSGNVIAASNNNLESKISTDRYGRTTNTTLKLKEFDSIQNQSCTYNQQGQLTQLTTNDMTETINYDNLGRVISINDKEYSYKQKHTRATNLIDKVVEGDDSYIYKYDNHNNITERYNNGQLKARYSYDKLDRLVREDNVDLNKSYTYVYYNNGNILYKNIHDFSLGVLTDGIRLLYGYLSGKLKNYNGQTFDYDKLGNPIFYKNKNLKWTNLKHLRKYGHISFDYDANGIRTQKSANGTDVKFTYAGDKLLAEKRSTTYYDYLGDDLICGDDLYCYSTDVTIIQYLYGISGVAGFTLKKNNLLEQKYTYRKNIQGDVTHILDKDSAIVGQYIYDAWGNHEIVTDIDRIATLNPIRYRGYYYDTETNLYYLKSRYYDPETGRFINQDSISYLEPERLNGLNLYAYCGNNPIMNIDPNGCSWNSFWNNRWNDLKSFGNWVSGTAKQVGQWFEDTKDVWAGIGSVLLMVGGIALISTGVGGILGGIMLSSGASSLAGGFINRANGGSFIAGWTGGLMAGLLAGTGASMAGLFFSGVLTAKVGVASMITTGIGFSVIGGISGSYLGTLITSKMDGVSINHAQSLANAAIFGILNIGAGFMGATGQLFPAMFFESGSQGLSFALSKMWRYIYP